MKLYLVSTKSFEAYVAEEDVLQASKAFENWLEKNDYGYYKDRKVIKIQLLAEEDSSPNSVICTSDLFINTKNG